MHTRNGNNGQQIELPPGGIDLSEDLILYKTPTGHRYMHLPTGTWCKGLTKYLDNLPKGIGFTIWLVNQGSYDKYQEFMRDAGIRGSEFHEAVEDLLTGKAATIKRGEMRPDSYKHTQCWLNWYNDYRPETVAVEQGIVDTSRKVATMVDWRGGVAAPARTKEKNGEMIHTVLNWKTSGAIYDSAVAQVSEEVRIYNNMEQDDCGPVEQFGIVRTGAKTKQGYEYKTFDLTKPEDRVMCEKYNRIVDCLIEVENLLNPDMEPRWPEPLPRELKLPE